LEYEVSVGNQKKIKLQILMKTRHKITRGENRETGKEKVQKE
jgi:hypothetical protein